jgi:hypothetical protein
MSLHSPDVLHGSGANTSAEKRVGFAIRFVAPENDRLMCNAPFVLARGRAPSSGCRIVEPPREADGERALLEMKRSAAAHFDSILDNLRHAET